MITADEYRGDIRIVDQIQANMVAYFRLFVGLPGIIAGSDDVFWVVSTNGEPGNQVLQSHIAEASAEERIAALLVEIGAYCNTIDWLVFPGCQPHDLGKRLAARGMPAGPGGTWMLADLSDLAQPGSLPAGFRVVRVSDRAMLTSWWEVSGAGFGSDVQIHFDAYARHGFGSDAVSLHYIGYHHDTPVTSATLLLAGGIAGIWDVSTPPAVRGRGYGSAITSVMLQIAREHGYSHAWVWSSIMGKEVYRKLGFVAADFGIREYQWRGADQSSAA